MRDTGFDIRNTGYGICVIIFLLAGCVTAPDNRPAWLFNPQELYPRNEYLSAVGEGDSRRAAENSATAGLARIFESSIEANELLSETAHETEKTLDRISELRTDVRIRSSQDLLNVQFGETFTDHNGRIHVAAFIPRAETAEIIHQRIRQNSDDVLNLTQRSDQAAGPLEAYALRRAAVRKALENDRLLAQLDIITPGYRPALPYALPTLTSETAAAAQKITFSVMLPDEAGGALREALTNMRFVESSPAILNFSGSATVEKTDLRRDPLVFVRFRYQIEARTSNGDLILSISDSHREGHINFEQATDRAHRNLRSEILTQIPRKLSEVFNRLASPR